MPQPARPLASQPSSSSSSSSSSPSLRGAPARARCTVHSCLRCRAALPSDAPCSFSLEAAQVCRGCRAQAAVLEHLPSGRDGWAARLAQRAF